MSIGGGYCYALTEAAAESATLDVGRLSFGNQGANGQYPGSFLMLNHTDDAYTLDADIDGYGIVAVLNGSTRLTGAATHTGGTLVFNGEAIVDGTLEGEVRLQGQTIVPTDSGGAAFAVLRGRGTVGSIDASAASRVQAGDDLSIGTLTATGSATFHEGSEYRARLAANGQADRLNVQGSVTIEGGTVFHMVAVDLLDAYAPNSCTR